MRKTGFRTLLLSLAVMLAGWAGAPARATELGSAVMDGDLAQVEALIAAGADVNKGDMFGTPLHLAAARGNVDIVTALLDAGADIEAKGTNGARPLHAAAIADRAEVAALLIARGADLESRDNNQMTPLLVAAANGSVDAAEVLLDAGADRNARGVRFQFNAIEEAAYDCQVPVVELLLSQGIDVNAPINDKGETLLFLMAPTVHEQPATVDDRLAMIDFLLASGLDPNIRNTDGKTALDLTTEPEIRAVLVERGAEE